MSTEVGSQLRHNAVNDGIGDGWRQLERITFGHKLDSFPGGVVQNMTSAAVGQMQFEFLAHLGRDLILHIVREFREEFLTCDHWTVPLVIVDK